MQNLHVAIARRLGRLRQLEILAAFVALLCVACAAPAFAGSGGIGTGAISGVVKSVDGTPISGAVVTISGNGPAHTIKTGSDGTFLFNGLGSGTYIVSASAGSYDALGGRTIDISPGQVTTLELAMARSSTSLVTIGQVRAGSGVALPTLAVPATTINSQAYAALGYTRVSDVVQTDISTTLVHPLGGAANLFTSVALRGPDPTETLVDIDGHQVNSGNTGDFDLSLLDPADFSSIELVKGISPSSLVGPDTIDGAVNIRTLEPTTTSHGLLRLSTGSFNSFTGTIQATGTVQQRLGYAVELHRVTSDGEVNQTVLAAPDDPSDEAVPQQVGSTLTSATALAKLRYDFGRSDGFVALSFHDQSQNRDLSAALSSLVPPPGTDDSGDAFLRQPLDAASGASLPLVNSFAGTWLQAHNAGYGVDARIPFGVPDASGAATTSALLRHYTSLVSQSVTGPGADTSPYLYNNRDYLTDDSIEIDHQFPAGTLSLQYGIRNEALNTDFANGLVVDESIFRHPLDSSGPSGGTSAELLHEALGQTQRTAAIRYTGDVSAQFHVALAAYDSNYSSFGSSFDPRVGFSWTPNAQSVVRASVGTTFQAPQLPELLVPPVLPPPVGGVVSIGNPNLKADFATEYSLGFEHIFSPGPRRTDVSVDVYRVNLRAPASILVPAPIQGCGGSSSGDAVLARISPAGVVNPPPHCPLSYPVNAGDGVYQGIELQATHQFGPFTALRAGWAVRSAYLTNVPPNIQDGTLVVGEQSLGLPLQKATLSFDRTPQRGFVAGAGVVWEGAYNELNQPPYAVLNANVGYRFRDFELGLSGTNLTNVYDQRFTRLGLGVPYGSLDLGPIATDAYALQGTALTLTLTRRF